MISLMSDCISIESDAYSCNVLTRYPAEAAAPISKEKMAIKLILEYLRTKYESSLFHNGQRSMENRSLSIDSSEELKEESCKIIPKSDNTDGTSYNEKIVNSFGSIYLEDTLSNNNEDSVKNYESNQNDDNKENSAKDQEAIAKCSASSESLNILYYQTVIDTSELEIKEIVLKE